MAARQDNNSNRRARGSTPRSGYRQREVTLTPFHPHRADAGAARTSPGRYLKQVESHHYYRQMLHPRHQSSSIHSALRAGTAVDLQMCHSLFLMLPQPWQPNL